MPDAVQERTQAQAQEQASAETVADVYLGPGDSLDDQVRAVRRAFYDQFNPGENGGTPSPRERFVQDVYSSYLVAREGANLYRVDYVEDVQGNIAFTPRTDWTRVRQVYVPAAATLEGGDDSLSALGDEPVSLWFGPLYLEDDPSGNPPEWIPIHRLCKRKHPVFGEIEMTEAKMDKAIANFKQRTLRPESPLELQIPVDTRHSGDAACAWTTDMRKALPYLMARVSWTNRGRQVVKDRQFLYISPVYVDHPERGPIFKEVTLTNRDFLKMPPIVGGQFPPIIMDDGVWRDLSPLVPPELESEQAQSHRRQEEMPQKDEVNLEGQGQTVDPKPTKQADPKDEQRVVQLETQLSQMGDRLTKALEVIDQQSMRLAESEQETKAAEIKMLGEAALKRGVDAFTVRTMTAILQNLPRKDEGQEIVLGEGDKAQTFKGLYPALSHYLQNAPATVPQGEITRSLHEPQIAEGNGDGDDIDLEETRGLMKKAGALLKQREE